MKMTKLTASAVVAVAMLMTPAARAHAQGGKTSSRDCRRAARIVAKGHPEKKEPAALSILASCGAVGSQAIATGMGTYRTETDTLALETFMRAADSWRDGSIMEAAIQLAQDGSATPQSRVFAIRHLTRLVNPLFLYLYGNLATGDVATRSASGELLELSMGCAGVMSSAIPSRVGTPLPTDYAARIRDALTSLAAQADAPAPVRNAAGCANYAIPSP